MIIIYVPDVKKTLDFYEKAFGWKPMVYDPEGTYGDVKAGDCNIGLVREDTAEYPIHKNSIYDKPAGISIAIDSKDVLKDYNRAILNGAKSLVPPHPTYWSKLVAVVTDPWGVVFVISGPSNEDYMKKLIVYNK